MGIDKQKAVERAKKQYKYINEYQKDNYDRITLLLPKGLKNQVESITGERFGVFCKSAVVDAIEKLMESRID